MFQHSGALDKITELYLAPFSLYPAVRERTVKPCRLNTNPLAVSGKCLKLLSNLSVVRESSLLDVLYAAVDLDHFFCDCFSNRL